MKRAFFLLIVLCLSSELAFGDPCADERKRAKDNRDLCNTWCDISQTCVVIGVIGGAAAAAYVGWVGGLGGLAGLPPGVVAARICDLADEKDQALFNCVEKVADAAFQLAEAKRDTQARKVAQAYSAVLTRVTLSKRERVQEKCNREIDDYVDRFINDDTKSKTDPAIVAEMQQEIERITKKYF